jgi:hypothetical protein
MTFKSFQSNNDFDPNGRTPAEVAEEAEFEMRTGAAAYLALRSDLNKAEALRELDNLRWLVEQSFPSETTPNQE